MIKQPNHTQIPNQFIDQYMEKLSGSGVKCFIAICRKTIGWHKETDSISISQLKIITGLSNKSIISAIDELINNNLIIKERTRTCNKYTVNFLENEKITLCEEQNNDKDVTKLHTQSVEITQEPVTKLHSGSVKITHTKETIQNKDKETSIKDIEPLIQFLDYVFLTQKQYDKLIDDYGELNTERFIEKLDTYLTDHPKKQKNGKLEYKDHNKTIRNWMNNERAEKPNLYIIKKPQKKDETITEIEKFLEEKYNYG